MMVFRQHSISKFLALLTGVIFLNMSFFLAEVSMLKLKDPKLAANIAKLISTGGFEEERDGESSGSDTTAKEIDLLTNQNLIHHKSLFVIASRSIRMLEDLYPHANYAQTYSPPPDLFSRS